MKLSYLIKNYEERGTWTQNRGFFVLRGMRSSVNVSVLQVKAQEFHKKINDREENCTASDG